MENRLITFNEVCHNGACVEGVKEFYIDNFYGQTAVSISDAIEAGADLKYLGGNGDGYGYGYGYWAAVLRSFSAPNATLGFWRSDSDGRPSNGGHTTAARVGLKEEMAGPLQICSRGFHATLEPTKWNGERLWVVALYGEIQREDDKLCALKREFLAEIL